MAYGDKRPDSPDAYYVGWNPTSTSPTTPPKPKKTTPPRSPKNTSKPRQLASTTFHRLDPSDRPLVPPATAASCASPHTAATTFRVVVVLSTKYRVLYYVCTDTSNSPVDSSPGFPAFATQLASLVRLSRQGPVISRYLLISSLGELAGFAGPHNPLSSHCLLVYFRPYRNSARPHSSRFKPPSAIDNRKYQNIQTFVHYPCVHHAEPEGPLPTTTLQLS